MKTRHLLATAALVSSFLLPASSFLTPSSRAQLHLDTGALVITSTADLAAQGGMPISTNLIFDGTPDTTTGTLVIAANHNITFDSASGSDNRLVTANYTSAAFYLETGATMTIQGNHTSAAGSAISLGTNAMLVLAAADDARYVFTDNIGGGGGGIIAVLTGYADITNALIQGVPGTNVANNAGVNVSSGTLKLTNSTLANIQAGGNGGAIYIGAASPATPRLELNGVLFDSNRAGTANNIGGAIFLATNANVTINSSTFSDNKAPGSGANVGGGAIGNNYAITSLNLDDVTFDHNYTTGAGGALYAAAALPASGATLTFFSNTADTYGGAIGVNNNSTLNLTDATFTANTSGAAGGAIGFNTAATLNLAATTAFTANTSGAAGGAIGSVTGALTLTSTAAASTITFTDNHAAANGGAISTAAATARITLANATFASNTAATNGGAIAIAGNTSNITLANFSFTDNTATTAGGAIALLLSLSSTLNLNVTSGTSLFSGNTANAKPNSIFIDARSSGGTAGQADRVNIDVADGALLDMLDPMELRADIGSNNTVIAVSKTGLGTWNLSGTTFSSKTGLNTGTVSISINQGTLHLYGQTETSPNGATHGPGVLDLQGTNPAGGNTTYFTVASGATLSIGGGNAISMTIPGATTGTASGNLTLAQGSILSLNLDPAAYTAIGATQTAGDGPALLTLTSANLNLFTSGSFNFSLDLANLASTGTYNLLTAINSTTANNYFDLLGINNTTNLLFYNDLVTGIDDTLYSYKTGITDNTLWIAITEPTSPENNILTWTGQTSTSWKAADSWQTLATTTPAPTAFTQGDIINLADTTNLATLTTPVNTTINIDTSTTATIAAMYVSGTTSYTLTGAPLETSTTIGTLASSPAATGKLILGAHALDDASDILTSGFTGTLTLANTSNNFTAGIEINTGELIGNAQTLVTNTITIATGATLTITQTTPATYASPITGNGALNKTGAAPLTLTADNASFGGTTSVSSGALLLAATLGGDINVNATGTLGGIGTVAGNVTLNTGAALKPGTLNSEPGTLNSSTFAITGALAIDTGATLLLNLYDDNASDKITTATLSILGPATIDINTVKTGTYTLIDATNPLDATTLANATTLAITNNGETITGRVTAHAIADTLDNNLLLSVDIANTSGTWTGLAGNTWSTLAASWTNPADALFKNGDAATLAPVATATITIAENITAAAITIDTTAGDLTLNGPSAIATSTAATSLDATDLDATFGKLIKTGPGTLTLSNTAINNFQKGIDLQQASLTGNADTLATPSITTAPSTTLTFDQATTATTTADITGAGNLVKLGSANLTLDGLTTYGGTTTVSSGALTLANADQIAASAAVTIAAGATLDATSGAQTLNQLTGAGNITAGSGALTLSNSAATTTYSGIISGAAPVTKLGASTLTLDGNNTFTGTLTIAEGSLQLGNGSTAAGSVAGPIDIAANATLILNHGTNNFAMTAANALTGNGLITKLATDTGALTLAGNSSAFTGTTNILAGSLALSNNASLGGDLNLSPDTTLAGAGTLHNLTTLGSATLTIGDPSAPSPSPSTLTLTGTLTLAGPTTLNYDAYGTNTSDLITAAALVRGAGSDTININLGSFSSGTYTLVKTTETLTSSATASLTLLSNGNPLSGRTAADFDITSGTTLNLIIASHNLAGLVWDGTNTTLWQHNQTNWQTNDAFLNGDTVIFDDTAAGGAGAHDITVDTAGVHARAMTVNSGSYTYTGGAITTSATTASSLAAGVGDGKLTLAANTNVTLSNTAGGTANNFEGGITIAPAAALTGNADTLHVGASLATPSVILNDGTLTFNQTTEAGDATYASAITGAGSLVKTGAAALTLTNAAYTGGLNVQQGALTLNDGKTTTDGPITIAVNANLLIGSAASYTVQNALTGNGTLDIALTTPAGIVDFTAAAGTAFSGTVNLGASTFTLNATNAAALANATLSLGAGNTTTVAPADSALQPFSLSALSINGGLLHFSTTIPADTQASGIIQTTTLALGSSGTIQVTLPTGATDTASTGATLFAQSTGATVDKLITAATVTGNASSLTLVDQTGIATGTTAKTANITQNGVNVATGLYNYALANTATSLDVNYKLTALAIDTGKTLVLAPAPGDTGVFSATITGAGNLAIDATLAPVTLAAANTYTGTTTLASGTLIAGANNALGAATNTLILGGTTSVSSAPAFNLNAKTQTLSTLSAAAGATLNLASGTLTLSNGGSIDGAIAGAGALNLTGGNLTLSNANPALTAATTISGNGNLSIDASAAPVTLGAANNFTGAATVTSGTLVSGANNALGSANTLTLANDAAYDLNGKSQTLSTLTTASTSTLNLNSGNLAIANGGAVNGALAGAGALNLTGGNLAIATANPDLAAPITIAATATATMGDLAALGAGAIANNGALTFANTAPGTLANSITGPGALNLNGAGITTIDHGNSLTGPVAVNGPVVASNLYALGTGDITVGNTNPAATLTYTVGGTIASNITGPGSLNLAASSGAIPVTLVGNNTITTINALDGANIVAANANALRSTYLKLTNATVTLTAPDTALGNVTLNGASKITFANLAAGAATAASLTAQTGGDGATPTLAFNTNIGAGASNTLDVAGPANGTFIIDISNTGNFPTANSTNISLVKAASGAPNYVLGAVTGTTFAGAMTTFNFDLSGTDAASGITLNIVRGDSLSPTGGAIVANATSSMPLTWFAELENIGKRLGDLHITTREKPGSDLWVRGYTQRINVNNKANPVPFNETQYGIEAGLDYGGQFVGQDSSFYVGAFLGYGTSDRDVKDSRVSDGSSINNHGGFYVTIIAPNGSYFDFVCKYDNFKNSLNALSDDGPMNADYHTSAVGASIELGKRTTYKSGWYVIPSVQASAVRINAADYTALTDKPSYNLVVSQEAINTNQLKGGLLAGYTRPLDNGQAIQPYASLYYARQWTSGGAINVRSANFVADEHGPYWSTIEGARVDAAIGFNWQYKKNLQMYFEYECSFARDYKKPYGLTLGIRRSW